MKTIKLWMALVLGISGMAFGAEQPLRVVTTLPDYADIAKRIGGDRVEVQAIVHGEQDRDYPQKALFI